MILIGVGALILISILVGGIFIGKAIIKQQDIKKDEQAVQTDILNINKQIKTSTKNADALMDSSTLFKNLAVKEEQQSNLIQQKKNKVIQEEKNNLEQITLNNPDKTVVLFNQLAQEYIDSNNLK